MDPKKRQVIIVAAAVLFSLYGLFDLAGGPKKGRTVPDAMARAADLKAFIAQTAVRIAGARPSVFDSYVMRLAGSNWGRNPFSGEDWMPEEGKGKGGPAARPGFAYNGYVQKGNRSVAVINDREYRAGDQLEEKGFFVKKISPAKVLIKNKGEGTEFEVPLYKYE